MLNLDQSFAPSAPLSSFVESYRSYTVSKRTPDDFMIPEGIVEVVFQLDAQLMQTGQTGKWSMRSPTFIGGLHSVAYHLRAIGEGDIFSIRFKPGGFSYFSGIPTQHFKNQLVGLSEAWGVDGQVFEDQVLHAESNLERCLIAERFLSSRFVDHPHQAVVNAAIELVKSPQQRISELAANHGLSPSRFRHLFNQIIGCSPKEFVIIRRLNQAYHDRKEAKSLAQLAHALGYYDQAHFIRDCQKITGYSPSVLLTKKLITSVA